MCPSGTGYNYFLACDTAERIIFTVVAGSGSGKLCWHSRGNDNDQENAGYVRESAGGSEQVLRLRAQAGAFRAPARVTFFFCKKKVTKENHSNLRFKDPLARGRFRRCGGELAFPWRGGGLRRPHFFLRRKKCGKESRLDLRSKGPLARGGQVRIWRCVLAGGVQLSSLSVKRTVPAFTGAEAGAAACPSHGRGVCFYRVGGVSPLRRRVGFPLTGRRPPAATFLCAKKEMWERKSLRPTV